MSDEEDDIILSELDDEELVQQMFDDLYDGLKKKSKKESIYFWSANGSLTISLQKH